MIKRRRDQTGFGALDYVLMAVGNCFAVYSAGMAVGASSCGVVFVCMIVFGTVVSYAFRRLLGETKLANFDSAFYTAATLSAVMFTTRLNGMLPDDGIPADVTTAGWLCWMLGFGSFFTWRDRTLLFQAVPTIALFGLIGCYDTYAPAPFLFFGFLLCLATLLGRSHSRDMLRQAVLSGYFNRADSPLTISEHPEQSPELYEDIKRGPWRWLAGPEWALGSGLAIVVLSLLGAPVIRAAVEPISGAIKVFAPRHLRPTNPINRVATQESNYEVGRGPLSNPNAPPRAQFTAEMDHARYLRTSVFDLYTGRGWSSSVASTAPPESSGIGGAAAREMEHSSIFHVVIGKLTPAETIPLPAEVTKVYPTSVDFDSGGSLISEDPHSSRFEIEGVESKATPKEKSLALPGDIRENCLSKDHITSGVLDFVKESLPTQGTDYDKAVALKEAIGARCNYSKQASAVPSDTDAADYFLNQSRVGYCDLFATAMVECARAIGIPAHFCIGYLPDTQNTDPRGQTVIFDQDYHAWAELYFKGVGWVVFDATEGAKSLDPNHTANSGLGGSGVLAIVLDGLIGLCVIVGAALLIAPKLKRIKTPQIGDERSEVKKVYLAFYRMLYASTHERRQISETTAEYVKRLGPDLGSVRGSVETLNSNLEAALYGPATPSGETLKGFSSQIKSLRHELKQVRKGGSHGPATPTA